MDDRCTIAMLDFRAAVEGPPDLVAAFRALRPPWRSDNPARVDAHFRISVEAGRPLRYRIEQDGRLLGAPRRPAEVLAYLDRAVNGAAVAALPGRYLLVHAGAVAYRGRGCVLPARSGSGKTTLVAGLCAAGCAYFSDEVAVVDPATTRLLPFAKPLGVKAGGRRVLARAYPALRGGLPRRRIDGRALWQLPPPPDAWPRRAVSLHAVVLPTYVPHHPTTLTSVPASVALPEVLRQVDTGRVLQSGLWRAQPPNGQGFGLTQPLPNGDYAVYVWAIENYASNYRDVTLRLEGATVASGIGDLPRGAWRKYGPYPAAVRDGALSVEVLRTSKGDPAIAGLAVFAP